MNLFFAIRVFFRILFDREAAEQIRSVLTADREDQGAEPPRPAAKAPPRRPARSDSLTLLATLQREARFIDFVQESLEGYSDAQIGAAARDVHRDCAAVLARLYDIHPVTSDEEGADVEVAAGYDPSRWKLTGRVEGEPPFRGRLAHHGWEAAKCELPEWSGSEAAARVLAPMEVELK